MPDKLDFMIIGAQKSGTTALAHFLSAHPEIAMAEPKEAHVFDNLDRLGLTESELDEHYAAHFRHAPEKPCRGEATPIYLFLPDGPELISRYNSQIKLIVLLRDPVARAISHYRMSRSVGRETLPLLAALAAERRRLGADTDPLDQMAAFRHQSYRSRGYYTAQIERYLEFFPADQLLILSTESLREAHAETLDRVHSFLGVSPAAPPTAEIIHAQPALPSTTFRAARWLLRLVYRRERERLHELLDSITAPSDW